MKTRSKNKDTSFTLICLSLLMTFLLIAPANGLRDNITNENLNDKESVYTLIRINITNTPLSLPKGFYDIAGGRPGEWIDIIIPVEKIKELKDKNVQFTILIEDVDRYSDEVRGSYHTLAQINQILRNIANTYPSITRLTSIGSSYEGREILCLEITDNPGVDEDEPGVLLMGLHHAREWPTVEICLYIANRLTTQYSSNPDVAYMVNNRRIWIIPVVNPDGYYYSHDLGNTMWRKNRHYFPEYGTYGVDLNRNYPGSCNGDIWGAWGTIGSGSQTHNPSSDTYVGPNQFSELELQAVRSFILNNEITASISYHTYGELVLYPWGYSNTQTPDHSYLSSVAQQIAQRITKQSGSGTYTPQQSVALYPTTGDSDDWLYGYTHYVIGSTLFSYTIETCSSFQPAESYLDQICMENYDGAWYLIQEAENIKNTVTPRVMPPVINPLPPDTDGSYNVSWMEKNPSANPSYFQLDELTDLSLLTDGAESGSSLWVLNGFSVSTARYHSGARSFKSRSQDSDACSMTTVHPLPVTPGMSLSFWCWYDTETRYDYAFVEVSKDGRYYDVLDKFNGASSGWVYKQYSLSDYTGDSVFIRFRYTTDGSIYREGFYVDDITPVPSFNTVTTLSSSIMNNYYQVTGRSPGVYYYRVKGYNTARGWGDFSELVKVEVLPNSPPMQPMQPYGPVNAIVGVSYQYTTRTIDPDGDQVYYMFDWGNGSYSGWLGPYQSGVNVTVNHSWPSRGIYQVKVKAKDTNNAESIWSSVLNVRVCRLGDVNNDGLVTLADIDPFVLALVLGEQEFTSQYPNWCWHAADCNLDGMVTLADVDPFVVLLVGGK